MTADTDQRLDDFLDGVRNTIITWANVKDTSCLDKLSGVAHSILTLIDGMAGEDQPPFERDDMRMLNDELYSEDFKDRLQRQRDAA